MPPNSEDLQLTKEQATDLSPGKESGSHRALRAKRIDLLKILFSVLVLVFLVTRVKPSQMAAAISEADFSYLLLALAILPLNLFWQSSRWWLLLKKVKPEVSFRESFQSTLVGLTLGLTIPGGVGGWGKILIIPEKNRATLLGLAVAESLSMYFATLFWGLPALAFFLFGKLRLALLIMLVFSVVIITVVLLRKNLYQTIYPLIPFKSKAADFGEAVKLLGAGKIFTILGISLVFFLTFNFQLFLIVRAFVDLGGIFLAASIFLIFLVKNSFPIGFGDLGTREGAAIFFLGKCGISSSQALDSSLLLFAINMLLPALFGSLYLKRLRLRAK
jgi:uncharacterized membrane protein YbhN (UPF0104 family)